MTDSSSGHPPGWFADPTGRHEHRWWDGTAWTDQVADGGVTSADPMAGGTAEPAASAAPGGRRVPVGVLAVVAGVVVGLVLGAVVLATGAGDGDDRAEDRADDRADDRSDDRANPDADSDTGARTETFDGTLDDGDPAVVVPIDLEAGAPLRVVVDADEVDVALQLAVEPDALEEFRGLIAPGGDPTLVDERLTRQAAVLWYAVDDGVSDIFVDDQDLDSLASGLAAFVPEVVEAGPLFLGTDRTSSGDPEGIQFVAPADGRYALVVSGGEGEFEGTFEVGDPADDAPDPEDLDYLDYLALYEEHVGFFCDEGFFGGDPDDVTNYGPTLCDDDTLAGVLAGELNGDFTNDFGGGEFPFD